MNMLDGKKTIIGAIFLAVMAFSSGVEQLLGAEALVLGKAITGGIGTFFAGVGIAGKLDKANG